MERTANRSIDDWIGIALMAIALGGLAGGLALHVAGHATEARIA